MTVLKSCLAALTAVFVFAAASAQAADDKPAAPAKPALTVNAVLPQAASLPLRIAANGNIAPWQEASIGTEAGRSVPGTWVAGGVGVNTIASALPAPGPSRLGLYAMHAPPPPSPASSSAGAR